MRNMRISAVFTSEVQIDPVDVIQKLLTKELGCNASHVIEKENVYYKVAEVSAGTHSVDIEIEITKETYEYIKALQLVLNKIKQ